MKKESINQFGVKSESLGDFVRVMSAGQVSQAISEGEVPARLPASGARVNIDPEKVKNGLGQLVLTLVKLLHELLERQALRRIEAGTLTEDEIEGVGLTLMQQAQEIERLRQVFGLDPEDLNLDLGPLGTLL